MSPNAHPESEPDPSRAEHPRSESKSSSAPPKLVIERAPADPVTMRSVGAALGRLLRPGELVLLFGELGAGKTTLVTGIAEGLGHDPRAVSSPTFVLCQEYTAPTATTLVHIDAWRMRGGEDLESIGWDELRGDPRLILCLEWPERVIGAIGDPKRSVDTVIVEIEHAETGRLVRITIDPERAAALDMKTPVSATARCRTCQTAIDPDSDDAPFCSSRCRMADLHRWFTGEHRIPGTEVIDDEDDLSE